MLHTALTETLLLTLPHEMGESMSGTHELNGIGNQPKRFHMTGALLLITEEAVKEGMAPKLGLLMKDK